MKSIVYKQSKGSKPTIYCHEKTLKEAKKLLSNKYMIAHELLFDEIVEGRDRLSKDGKTLELFHTRYFIEQDRSL